jgi:hypothetical protein
MKMHNIAVARWIWTPLLACATIGCADGAREPQSHREATTRTTASASEAATGAAVRRSRESPGSPLSLVEEYVRRDAGGARLREDAWSSGVVTWEEEPGWDIVSVVRGYGFRPVPAAGDTARVEVRYRIAGRVEPKDESTYRFVPADSTEVQVFELVRLPSGWKIAAPQLTPHLLPAAAARQYSEVLDSASAAQLARLAGTSRP